MTDNTFLVIVVALVIIGQFYKKIQSPNVKKWTGTIIGLILLLMISGTYASHFILSFVVNALIILIFARKNCHIISFIFSFVHLYFFHTHTHSEPLDHIPFRTLIQMGLTLRMVGLAFEFHDIQSSLSRLELDNIYNIHLTFVEIMHYAFNYLGILSCSYSRYKTFKDYFELPFSNHARCNKEILKRLTYFPVYFVLLSFCIALYAWPTPYILSDEFYTDRSWLYRMWFTWPNCFMSRMRMYIGAALAECIYISAGYGAYPSKCDSKPGLGPTKYLTEMKELARNQAQLAKEEYDFKTVRSMNPYQIEFCITVRETIRNWNMCIQYWMKTYIYKRFPSEKLRTVVTLLVSAYWHGLYAGFFVSIASVFLYMAIEDIYVKLLLGEGTGKGLKVKKLLLWLLKMQAFGYLFIAYDLVTFDEIIRFYSSVYHCGLIFGILLYVIGWKLFERND